VPVVHPREHPCCLRSPPVRPLKKAGGEPVLTARIAHRQSTEEAALPAEPRRRGGHAPDPIGTIVVRRHHDNLTRFVKVSMTGTVNERWMEYARWWWVRNRGPVPDGKRIGHLDGDTLNDDPANLAPLDPGDVAFLWHERDPKGSARNYAKCRKATAAFNRDRGLVNRGRNVLPTHWYPVDFDGRRIHLAPRRMRWQVYRDAGLDATADNWRSLLPASLGFPGVRLMPACILAVLADGRERRRMEIIAAVAELRRPRGWDRRLTVGHFSSCCSELGVRVLVRRRGRHRSLYRINPGTASLRGPVCPVVPVRGCELGDERFAGFERVVGDSFVSPNEVQPCQCH
jgi:hypothetical protein